MPILKVLLAVNFSSSLGKEKNVEWFTTYVNQSWELSADFHHSDSRGKRLVVA